VASSGYEVGVARAGRSRAAIALVLVGLAGAGVVAAAKPKVLKRLVLDDFEAPAGTRNYAILDETLAPSQRGRIDWRLERCRRSGAAGHCLHVRYAFDRDRPEQVSLRIDLGDLDASDYDAVELWVKPDPGSSPTLKLGFRRPHPELANIPQDGTTVIDVGTGGWRRVVVPLNRMSGIAQWKHVRSVFLALESRRAVAAREGGYWIDDVELLKTGGPGPTIADEVHPKKKAAWVASVGGGEQASRLIRDRLAGWPKRLVVDKQTLPREDRAFTTRLAADTWAGIDALRDRENGLPVDHVTLSQASLDPPASRVSDYTNVTNVGLHLMATVAARDLGLITAGEATDSLLILLD
jgi:hypothetical protein